MPYLIEKITLRIHRANHFVPAVALAAIENYPENILDTPEKVENLFWSIADWFFTIFLIVAVIAIIYTAFMYLTSTGDPTKLKKARTSLTFAIVAIAIAILAAGIPTLIQNLLEGGAQENTDPRGPSSPGAFR